MPKSRYWTKEECDYLADRWGTVSIPAIAKTLNRSADAVVNKARKMSLGPVLMSGDYITLNQLLIAVTGTNGGGDYIKTSWVKNRGFPVHTKKVNACSFKIVYLHEFWDWAEKNRSFLDFSKMEPHTLGEEPAWVAEQRKNDFQAFAIQRKDPWTAEDDSRLKMLLSQHRYGYAELSQMLQRSAGAIQRRRQDLGIKDRPVRVGPHDSPWTDDDFAVLADGIKTGLSYTQIGNRIGKSEKAIRGKVYTVYFTESADKVRAYMGGGQWGDGAPEPTVKQAAKLSGTRAATRAALEQLCAVLKYRTLELKGSDDYDAFFQRKVCQNWDDVRGICKVGGTDCDACDQFCRVPPQFCVRCGGTFFEKVPNRICASCRQQRRRQAYRKYMALNGK